MKYWHVLIYLFFLLLTVACSKEEEILDRNPIRTFSFEIEIPASQATAGGASTNAKGSYDPSGPAFTG